MAAHVLHPTQARGAAPGAHERGAERAPDQIPAAPARASVGVLAVAAASPAQFLAVRLSLAELA